jgi:hypothetical protein
VRFEIDLYDSQVVSLLNRMIAITGPEPWKKKFAVLQHQLKQNEFLREYQTGRLGIELTLRDALSEQQRTGAFPLAVQNDRQYRLYAFSASLVRIYEQLSSAGRARLRGMLCDGLKPDNNLLSLQHEINTAVHFVSRGFDVEFNDIERGSGVDLIARHNGVELEVECKMFTGDLGRQIHKRKVLVLHHHLSGRVEQVYRSAQTGILIRITIPDRLTCTPTQLQGIATAVARAVVSGAAITKTPLCEVQVIDFPIPSSPFAVGTIAEISRASIDQFVRKGWGITNPNLMMFFSPARRAVIFSIESTKRDQVLNGVYRQLREACKGQFTRTRPGHVQVQFQDLTAEEMRGLAVDGALVGANATGLQVMTTELLKSPNRSHIHSVAYRSHGSLLRPDGQAGALIESGIVSFTRNPCSPYYDDPRLRHLY